MQRLSLRAVALRLLLSAAATAAVVSVACEALFVTHAARPVSLLVEPFSLLLLPGLLVSLVVAGARDFSPVMVVRVSIAFYFLLFFLLSLRWRPARHRSL